MSIDPVDYKLNNLVYSNHQQQIPINPILYTPTSPVMDQSKMDRPMLHNPLPTPEEPLRHTFDDEKQTFTKPVGKLHRRGSSVISEKEIAQLTPSPVLPQKRRREEDEDEQQDNTAATNPLFGVDFNLFPAPTFRKSISSASRPSTASISPRGDPIIIAYNKDPQAYLLAQKAENELMWAARKKRQDREKAPVLKVVAKRQKRNFSEAIQEKSNKNSDPSPLPRAKRARTKTPATSATPVANVTPATTSTPPQSTPRRTAEPRRNVQPKKPRGEGPPKKKAKTVKNSPPQNKNSVDRHGHEIKIALNRRFEEKNMNSNAGKGAYYLYKDAWIPDIDLDTVGKAVDPKREGAQRKPLAVDDPMIDELHPKEIPVAEWIRGSASEYLTQKRRFFLGLAEWWRLGHDTCKRAHAQTFCNQDGNSSSYMHDVYEEWGFLDRSLYSDEQLENLPHLTGPDAKVSPVN